MTEPIQIRFLVVFPDGDDPAAGDGAGPIASSDTGSKLGLFEGLESNRNEKQLLSFANMREISDRSATYLRVFDYAFKFGENSIDRT
ncbi:hypothetical protein [Methylobacterium planeticum]|uniref:Uncharacterized protein n=1 Tax=Methylobacterium planeticum TaxID=2615211 RepID=A0A6N6MEV0_9HYPH|nr:hypothetical protein [Methylobacterium planeticum]KAB1068280.1 hypothetical protein F6X51_27025 [Methylobacterium planeticum]